MKQHGSEFALEGLEFRDTLVLGNGATLRLPAVMGVLNVTPDSFTDGGRYLDPEPALAHALAMENAGADIIDVGGESTRPGAGAVPAGEELRRLLPVLERLRERLRVPFSIDTRKAPVALAALRLGAAMVNDVSGLGFDPAMAATVAQARASLVLGHTRGTPDGMASRAEYADPVEEVRAELAAAVAGALTAGVPRERIIVDPGFGFAKNGQHNLALLAHLPRICTLGYPVMVGLSGKRLGIGRAMQLPEHRLARNAAAQVMAVLMGAAIVRVHEPAPAAEALRVVRAIKTAAQMGTAEVHA